MPCVATIGNFDGVHLGHGALLRAARERAGRDAEVVAVTFDPHPAAVLRPGGGPARLSTLAQRERMLRAAGADRVEVLPVTTELLRLAPEGFVDLLTARVELTALVEGSDFRFGRERAGDIPVLRALGERRGFEVIVVPPVEAALCNQSIVPVRSSLVRWLLAHGRVADARRLLGRPYEMECRVVRGDQRGRTIGCPTANLEHGDRLLPGDGVYSGVAVLPGGGVRRAAISVGRKSTFGAHERVCEAHLLDHDGPLDDYGWTIRLSFERWLRDQAVFASVAALREQMARDRAASALVS